MRCVIIVYTQIFAVHQNKKTTPRSTRLTFLQTFISKTLPSSAPPVERTVIQESAFPATADDASSAQFHNPADKTEGCQPTNQPYFKSMHLSVVSV